MSLYNTLFGVNPCAGTLLKMLGADVQRIPRFRDCFLKGNAIVSYTRTGGGNRDDYEAPIAWLRSLPGFLSEHDSSIDSTYAFFAYAIPERFADFCQGMRANGAERNPETEWPRLLAKLKDPAQREDPEVVAAMTAMAPIKAKLEASLDGHNDGAVRIVEV